MSDDPRVARDERHRIITDAIWDSAIEAFQNNIPSAAKALMAEEDLHAAIHSLVEGMDDAGFMVAGRELVEREAEIARATRLGYELGKAEGRKQAGEEIAQAIESQVGDGEWAGDYYRKAAQIARSIASQPQEATAEPLTAPDASRSTPEAERSGSIRIPGGEG